MDRDSPAWSLLSPASVRILLALLSSVPIAGCVVGEEAGSRGDDGDSLVSGTHTDRPVPANGLIFDADLAAQLPTTALGSRDAAGHVTLTADAAATFDTPTGRMLLKYVAICALPATDAIAIGGHQLDGYYGLAPAWETGACDDTCQRWVSACVLAHANKEGTPVQISVRGDHPAFAWETKILEAHTYQEAAYYGNIFRHEMYACIGHGLFDAGSESEGDYFINGRVCGYGGSCGLNNLGMCFSTVPDLNLGDAVCDHQPEPGAGFADCHYELAEPHPRTSPVFHEVVTVYLAP